ncbi:MAG: helix-turn-helix transcriptional regulator, partial [Candidatus Competibacteraceae bacterium]
IHAIVTRVIATANAQGNNDGELIAIQRRSNHLPYLVEIAPLRDDGQETGQALRGAMVFIVDPERTDVVSVKGLAVAFGLSKAEEDVCRRLALGRTNEEIADMRGVTLETVKSQVKAVLNKTRTRNRTELVHLAVKVLPPIDGTG